ncbi:hypothetical protein LAZ67_X003957 [Cordylochernes scorpioides]|uniref:RNA-directed DNA polymerase n=1 Tax=Cordylochernes scorpioides TaxID=51811 RepID=A0ABY6LV03_9ARAC|nr:hypothetical protein LAZ67_X003957 [Cordylochernes scorpioides]
MGRKRASTSSKEEPLEERRNMNLPFELIPRYDPDEGLSYDNWSRLFDHQAQQQGLSSKESLSMMPMLFKGKALEMYALICRDISSLEELHSRMKRFFHEPEHGLHRNFWQVRKGREQSVKEYYFAKIKLATKLGLSQELILEGLTSGIESEFERFLIAASPTSLERWLEIAEAIEISHCRTTSSASGMEMGYPARRRPSTSWQGGQGFRTRNWREGRNDRPGTHLPPTRSQAASLAAVQDHEDSGAVPYVLKSKPVYQPDAKPLPLPDTNDCFLHDNIELFTMVKILLDNHAEIFGENKFNIKPLNIQPPRLRLSDKKPVCVRPYRHSLRDRDLIKRQIEQLLKYGLIKPASSPYSAPVTLAPKKGEGRVRLCIDYRLLNRKIISDSFPIPLMEDIVQKVQGARVFSCLDILSAYWTIPLHPKDREMTCFSTSEGSKLSAILQKYKLDNVTSYFDDILVFSENEESHLKHLGQIFEILRKEGIQLRRDKCLLFMKRITYLGYEISENQISPSGVNVDVIKSLPPPRDLRCLRSFLGSLLKKNSRFIWTEECQRSFEGLKEALCSKPILQLFNPSLATHIYCDASTSGIGAVLKQEYPDGTQKPFTYFSRALRGAESKYTITELELLAVVETCKRYHPYISGSHVIVHTDHKALIWLNSFKHTNGRLFRWSLKLSEYDLDFNYNKGCENHEADMLSRLPYSYFLSAQALKQNQNDLSIPPSKLYSIVDGITYIRLNNKDRVVVPPELQDDLIQKAHESLGHPGISAMIRALSVQYYFKGMIGKINNYVKNCKECQTIKSSTQPSYGLMGSLPRAAKPFDVVALDTEKGIKHVMTSPSHPECNGLVERANATLIGRLKIQHQGNPRAPWPKLLQKTLEEYRDTPHSTTTFPPIYLLYGTLPSYMSDLTNPYPPVERARTIANEKTEELHKRLVKRYNSSHRFPNLKIGDKVLYRIPHQVGHGKLSPVYYPDPYTVLSTPSPHTVEINKPCQPENKPSTIVNVSKLKLWDPISTSNEGRRNYPFPFQDVEDLNGFGSSGPGGADAPEKYPTSSVLWTERRPRSILQAASCGRKGRLGVSHKQSLVDGKDALEYPSSGNLRTERTPWSIPQAESRGRKGRLGVSLKRQLEDGKDALDIARAATRGSQASYGAANRVSARSLKNLQKKIGSVQKTALNRVAEKPLFQFQSNFIKCRSKEAAGRPAQRPLSHLQSPSGRPLPDQERPMSFRLVPINARRLAARERRLNSRHFLRPGDQRLVSGCHHHLWLGFSAFIVPPAAFRGSGLACIFAPEVAFLRQRVLWLGNFSIVSIDVQGQEMRVIDCYLSRKWLEQLESISPAAAIREDAWVEDDLNMDEERTSDTASGSLEALTDGSDSPPRLDRVILPSRLLERVTQYKTIYYRFSDHRAVLIQLGSPSFPRQPCVADMLLSALVDEHLRATIERASESIANMTSEYL